MKGGIFSLPVRRPVAVLMFFAAILLVGGVAWQKIPVELFPEVQGSELFVNFFRPGSEPELVEREILLPLAARAASLPDVAETFGEVRGSGGRFRIKFRPGTDIEMRELDLNRLVADMTRTQPPGTTIVAEPDLFTRVVNSGFAMTLQVVGGEDRNSLYDFVDERILPRIAAVPDVAQVIITGGAPRELTVEVDPDLCAALGVQVGQVTAAIRRNVQRLDYLGGAEDEAGRTAIVVDGRPAGVVTLGDIRIDPSRPVLLRHVATIEMGAGREEQQYRVNAQPAVGLAIFQEEGANIVRLGASLRERLDELRVEFDEYGIDFAVDFDGGDFIDDQLQRLRTLALTGFIIALIVLYLFLRQSRAVAVVAIAVPTSLLCALALLFTMGESLNVITLFGLAVGIGMLVDNSIVVYEAVQRQLEHGAAPDAAAERGVARTVRAILAATATNAVVFLPVSFVAFDNPALRSMLEVLILAILTPLVGSLLVAVGLVPLLARYLAAPAALERIARKRRERERFVGWSRPERIRELFGGMLTVALRRPGGWITGVVAAVLLTLLVALPIVTITTATQEAPESDQVQIPLEVSGSGSLQATIEKVQRLELAAMEVEGVDRVVTIAQEDGATLSVHLVEKEERPGDVNAARIRSIARAEADEVEGLSIRSTQGGPTGGGLAALLGQGASSVVVSGPDAQVLERIAGQLEQTLVKIPEVGTANVTARESQEEIRVSPLPAQLRGLSMTADQVLPVLSLVRREGIEMQIGFTLPNGREIPLTVRRVEDAGASPFAVDDLRGLRVDVRGGVQPLGAMAAVRKMPAPPTIVHHDGRRELEVEYTLSADAPSSGPARNALEKRIREAIDQTHRPAGYSIETPDADEQISWFKRLLVPILLLLFAVLAITFESLTLPLLVLLTLPLTLLGATWALVLAGIPADPMALIGAVALIGLTVNPAILLVDRMQQRAWRGGMSAGAAALAAVRERARPVLMTTATTVAGLWPLAISTGQADEIWPPFATVVMGGLVTSTMLTLLVIPVGFVFLNRLDRLFGRVGPWVVLAWLAGTAAVIAPLVAFDVINSLTWQILTTLLVAGILLGAAVWFYYRPQLPVPAEEDGVIPIEARYLAKTYGRPGPVGRAWRVWERFSRRVLDAGGRIFDREDATARFAPLVVLAVAAGFLAFKLQSFFWSTTFTFVLAGLLGAIARNARRWRGEVDELGRATPGGIEGRLAATLPWIATAWVIGRNYLFPKLIADAPLNLWPDRPVVRLWVVIALPILVALVQFGRRTARRIAYGEIAAKPARGARLRGPRTIWRTVSRRIFGLDLPRDEVHALRSLQFKARGGMVGILGPNGAGKTTMLRLLAGILDPSVGVVTVGGVPLDKLRKVLARWIGYLPQDFGLPDDLTARQYLEYFALLYEIRPETERKQRVQQLIDEVGLSEKADLAIGGFSGGQRQRVAVARTLLRLPPIIIVDEPTVGLDPRERIRFRNLLARLAEGRVVLFSTHVVEDVEVACDRVIVMAKGRQVFDGEPARLSDAAQGKVWQATVLPEELEQLQKSEHVVDEVPELSGAVRVRILAEEQPHPSAQSIAPSLEDGYLWLVEIEGRRVAAVA